MDRRETIKSLLIGSLAGGTILTGCATESTPETDNLPAMKDDGGYGRTPSEKAFDEKLNSETYFSSEEVELLSTLVDIILPATSNAGSATEAGVPEFIEFIVKDMPRNQLPLRGGMMWLNGRSNSLFNLEFVKCSDQQQKQILDEIAYPDKADPALGQGVKFFSLLRNLTLTGYYTTEMGFKDLGYKGNTPNVWDGVPDDVLKKHGLSYDPEWLAKCIDQEKRTEIARWDDNGNIISD